MSALVAPSRPQIEHALDALLSGDAKALVLGLRSPTRQDWPEFIERGGRRFHIVPVARRKAAGGSRLRQ